MGELIILLLFAILYTVKSFTNIAEMTAMKKQDYSKFKIFCAPCDFFYFSYILAKSPEVCLTDVSLQVR